MRSCVMMGRIRSEWMRRLMLRWYLFIVFFFLERDLQCSAAKKKKKQTEREKSISTHYASIDTVCFEGHPTLGTITRYC